MAGNILINTNSVPYEVVPTIISGSASGEIIVSSPRMVTNYYYQLGEVEHAYVTLVENTGDFYNEYMFEVAFVSDRAKLTITTKQDLYWPRELTVRNGYRYQISILNQIALWTEVPIS